MTTHALWENVNISTGCWLWTGPEHRKYGWSTGEEARAHREIWRVTQGEIPEGLCVLHRCNTKLCCNPEHLYLGTWRENNQDQIDAGTFKFGAGEGHWNSQLTEDAVKDILINTGGRPMARKHNTTYSNVKMIRKRKRWGHVKLNLAERIQRWMNNR